jgi:hypothetical protein
MCAYQGAQLARLMCGVASVPEGFSLKAICAVCLARVRNELNSIGCCLHGDQVKEDLFFVTPSPSCNRLSFSAQHVC